MGYSVMKSVRQPKKPSPISYPALVETENGTVWLKLSARVGVVVHCGPRSNYHLGYHCTAVTGAPLYTGTITLENDDV